MVRVQLFALKAIGQMQLLTAFKGGWEMLFKSVQCSVHLPAPVSTQVSEIPVILALVCPGLKREHFCYICISSGSYSATV